MKMALTQDQRQFIFKNGHLTIESIQTLFFDKYKTTVATGTVHKYRHSLPKMKTETVTNTQKYRKTQRKTNSIPTYPTTLLQFLHMLEQYPDHHYTEHFLKRLKPFIDPKTQKYNRRFPDANTFLKFFEFIRDYNEKFT